MPNATIVVDVTQENIDKATRLANEGGFDLNTRNPIVIALIENGHKEALIGIQWAEIDGETFSMDKSTQRFMNDWIERVNIVPSSLSFTKHG